MNLLTIMLQAAKGGAGAGSSIIMLVLIVVIFYFFMIRPQSKRQKEEKKFREMLEKGQKVLTIGGLHGKVKEVKETTVLMEIAENTVIEVEKTAISMTAAPNQKASEKK